MGIYVSRRCRRDGGVILRATPRAATLLLLMLLPALPQAPAQDVPDSPQDDDHVSFDTSWLEPGYAAVYEGAAVNVGQGADPMRWWRFSHAILDRRGDTLVLHALGVQLQTGQVRTFTVEYDAATRRETTSPTRHATLWINDADVHAGHARIGDQGALLTARTERAYVFSTLTADYHYDRATGILLRANEPPTSASAVLAVDGTALQRP